MVPATEAGLGYSANVLIGDEAARWEDGDRIFLEVLEPTTTWTHGDIYLLSTPAGKQGFFWDCFNMRNKWDVFHYDWTANPYHDQDWADDKKQMHTPMSWAMNYEAKFVISEEAYFTPNEITGSVHPDANKGVTPGIMGLSVGVDFGKVNDKCIIDIGAIINPEKPVTDQIIRLLDRRVKPLGTEYSVVLEELKAINRTLKPQIFILDTTSGDVPSDILKMEGAPIESFKFTIPSKVSLMNNLKILMQQKRLQIPHEKELISQLETFEYKYSELNQDRVMLHAAKGQHDDEVDALALMVRGLTWARNIPYCRFVETATAGLQGKENIQEKAKKANEQFQQMIRENQGVSF